MFHTKVVGKINTCNLSPITFSEYCAVYEIIWRNIVELCRPQMTVWHICISCWIEKSTNTLRICNTYCFSAFVKYLRKNGNTVKHCMS